MIVECAKSLENHITEAVCICRDRRRYQVSHRKQIAEYIFNDSKNIYSSSKTMLLTWYSHKEYGNISVKARISKTTCFVAAAVNNTPANHNYSADIQQESQFRVELHSSQCYVLHINQWQQERWKHCSGRLIYLHTNEKVTLHTTGFFEGDHNTNLQGKRNMIQVLCQF